jgi:hypothetical protein
LVEIIHSSNLFVKEPIESNIRGLAGINLIEKSTSTDLFKPKLIQMRDNGLLKKQPINNQLVSPNSTQSNDILVNLIIGVNFLWTIRLKSCIVFQVLPLSTFQL